MDADQKMGRRILLRRTVYTRSVLRNLSQLVLTVLRTEGYVGKNRVSDLEFPCEISRITVLSPMNQMIKGCSPPSTSLTSVETELF